MLAKAKATANETFIVQASLTIVKIFLQNSGLYYKPMTIVNDDSRVITKLEASLTDNARVVIYDRHMFIVQPPGLCSTGPWNSW
jgi:hypothetical protein